MQKTSTSKIPVGISDLSKMMKMTEVEVKFFPKLKALRQLLKDYNFGVLPKKKLVDQLEVMKGECIDENIGAYAEGVGELKGVIQYRY